MSSSGEGRLSSNEGIEMSPSFSFSSAGIRSALELLSERVGEETGPQSAQKSPNSVPSAQHSSSSVGEKRLRRVDEIMSFPKKSMVGFVFELLSTESEERTVSKKGGRALGECHFRFIYYSIEIAGCVVSSKQCLEIEACSRRRFFSFFNWFFFFFLSFFFFFYLADDRRISPLFSTLSIYLFHFFVKGPSAIYQHKETEEQQQQQQQTLEERICDSKTPHGVRRAGGVRAAANKNNGIVTGEIEYLGKVSLRASPLQASSETVVQQHEGQYGRSWRAKKLF